MTMLPAFVRDGSLTKLSKKEALQFVQSLDLSEIYTRVAEEHPDWSKKKLDDAEERYRGFLFVCSQYKEPAVPDTELDEFWHAHILYTKKYASDCVQLFGRYLHHNPEMYMPRPFPERVGMDASVTSHHGEIIQGIFDGKVGLVTLPCPLFVSMASFKPSKSIVESIVVPLGKEKVRALLQMLKIKGYVTIRSNIPDRWGLGSSSADMLAALRASTNVYSSKEEGKILAAVEGTDPIMYDRAVLFCPKTGEILESFGKFPPMKIVGFNTDEKGMHTKKASGYTMTPEQATLLRDTVRTAIQTGDLDLLGSAATHSTKLMQKFRPKKHWKEINDLASKYGAKGIQVAHSGTVVGLIFSPEFDVRPVLSEARKKFGLAWIFQI